MQIWQALLELIASSLVFFYDLVPSYGIAIILLTIAVGILLFPLTLKQTRSMKAMAEIQPEVKRLQKEHKGDREKLNQELMALYRERGVNPAAGCLPLILQAPIWFALFRVLQNPGNHIDPASALAGSIERNASFLGMDLALSPSAVFSTQGVLPLLPYLALILLVVASGYYQQRQASSSSKPGEQSPQAAQMQAVTKFMPIMFGVFSWTFPTGLVIYFAASNIFRVGQQALIFRMDAMRPQEETTTPKETGEEKEKPASPHPSSKKRKKRKRR